MSDEKEAPKAPEAPEAPEAPKAEPAKAPEPPRVVNIFSRLPVVAIGGEPVETGGAPVVRMIDTESLVLAERVVELIKAGTLSGLGIVGVNIVTDVPVVAAVDTLPRLYQKTLALFAVDMLREGMTDNAHDAIRWQDAASDDDIDTIDGDPDTAS